jgi:GNAT superfamily N-acetyltransferase
VCFNTLAIPADGFNHRREDARKVNNPLTPPQGTVTVRPATPDDAALLRALRLEALAHHPEVFAADHAFTAAGSVESWAERITEYARDDEGLICVAATEDRLVGMAGLVRGHWPKTRHGATMWGVYVQAEWRGLGVGGALVEACVAWAQAQGVVVVKLGVVTTNTPAIRCYARCGFGVYGVDPKVIYYDGFFYDELLMARSI